MLPVRSPLYDVQPGGLITTVRGNLNALSDERLKEKRNELLTQMYPEILKSNLSNQVAQTNKLNIMTPLESKEKELQNQYAIQNNPLMIDQQKLQNLYNTQMNPLKIQQQQIINKLLPEKTQAEINSQNALSNYRAMGGSNPRGVDQQQRNLLIQDIAAEHPEWFSHPEKLHDAADAYLSGNNTLSDGTILPNPSGTIADDLSNISKRRSTVAIQNQAANMDILASDINDIDIKPVQAFSGIGGKINYAKYISDMAQGKPVPKEFRDYLAFKNVSSNFAMDSLRKGFGTSVVPSYVYNTLGKASNPNSSFWYDPEQVAIEWNVTKDWINKNAERYKKKANFGATANISEQTNNKKATFRYNTSTGELEEIK